MCKFAVDRDFALKQYVQYILVRTMKLREPLLTE